MRFARIVGLLSLASIPVLLGPAARTQQAAPPPGADWPMYRHDYSGTGYSPLTQINTKNVSSLKEVWSNSLSTGLNSQATPIVVNGLMYLPSADSVVALNRRPARSAGDRSSRAPRRLDAVSRTGPAMPAIHE